MVGGFRIGRLFGFEIRLDLSWFLVFALIVWTFSESEFPRQLRGYSTAAYYAMGVSAAILLFISVLFHEIAHSLMARARGIEIEGITLFIFGGVAQTRQEPRRAIDEFLITIVGPLASLAIAGGFKAVEVAAVGFGWPPPFAAVCSFLAMLNFVLAVFNMIPGFPLDGGRIFRSVLWAVTGDPLNATRWATWGGRIFGYLLIAAGIAELVLLGWVLAGLWAMFIGWFLSSAATAAWRQQQMRSALAHVSVRDIMLTDPVTVPDGLALDELIERYLLRHGDLAFPTVGEDGLVTGLVTRDVIATIAPDRRQSVLVRDIMRPLADVPVVEVDEGLDAVVGRIDPERDVRVLVMEEGRLVGVVGLADIGALVQRASDQARAGHSGEERPGGPQGERGGRPFQPRTSVAPEAENP